MSIARSSQGRVAFALRPHARRSRLTYRWGLLAVGLAALLIAACGHRNLPRSVQTVDGMTIYLGVMPAELVQGHSTTLADPQALHGGTPPNRSSHHIVVALFDAKTGARITDAQVRARVAHHSYGDAPDTVLAPMQINDTMSYGNFFLLEGSGAWRIRLEIRRPGVAHPVDAEFGYEHQPDH